MCEPVRLFSFFFSFQISCVAQLIQVVGIVEILDVLEEFVNCMASLSISIFFNQYLHNHLINFCSLRLNSFLNDIKNAFSSIPTSIPSRFIVMEISKLVLYPCVSLSGCFVCL